MTKNKSDFHLLVNISFTIAITALNILDIIGQHDMGSKKPIKFTCEPSLMVRLGS